MSADAELVGFIGLGLMGQPMALNLARAGRRLLVWNRSPQGAAALVAAGVEAAPSAQAVLARAPTCLLMLRDASAVEAVLGRGTAAFGDRVAGRTIVPMGTTSPAWSAGLAAEVTAAGGTYVEAPVSGSRGPAEAGALVAMLASEDAEAAARVGRLLAPCCAQVFSCGAPPRALAMKLAVNTVLISLVTGLAEAMHLAARQGLDLALFRAVLEAGPMASRVAVGKAAKLAARDFAPEAAIADVRTNAALIVEAARSARAPAPLLEACLALYARADRQGAGALDMAAVIGAYETRGVAAAQPGAVP